MGCTGEKTYEEAVKSEINRYLNGFNLLSSTKKEITTYINQDYLEKIKLKIDLRENMIDKEKIGNQFYLWQSELFSQYLTKKKIMKK